MKLLRKKIMIVVQAAFFVLASKSLYASDQSGPFKVGASKEPGCSSLSREEHDRRCRLALKRYAIEHCIENGQGTKVKEVEDTYAFEFYSAGECYNYPGKFYVATACKAYFECVGSQFEN